MRFSLSWNGITPTLSLHFKVTRNDKTPMHANNKYYLLGGVMKLNDLFLLANRVDAFINTCVKIHKLI